MSVLKIITVGELVLVCFLPPPADLRKQRRLRVFTDTAQTLFHVTEIVTGMNNLTVFTFPQTDLKNLSDGLYRLWKKPKHIAISRHVDISPFAKATSSAKT